MLGRLQLDIDPSVPAGSLRPEQQQMVEITRALSMDARVVILDEPTSSLPDDQVAALFEVVRALRDNGVAVAFVSHRFNEIFDLVDHVSVLRDGRLVGGGPIGEYDRASLVRQMIGQELENLTFEARPSQHADPVLRVRDFNVPGRVHGVDVAVERGEIVGVAGLVGSGRSALLQGLFGLESEAFGEVEIDGSAGVASDPRSAMKRGFGYVPADRKTLGAVMDMSIRENLLMAQTAERARVGRPPRGTERGACQATIERFRIVTPNQDNAVKNLSGGNQQKVVLAKWIATQPKVLMLDEPTRGVDVGAKAEIYKLLNQIKEEDVAILVSSSEAEELLLLCDTILVMHRGRLAASLSREEATDSKIAYYGMGHG
jgi:ABC-type sugar transport system ATPase subunit